LLTEVRLKTEQIFKTRKACPDKVFTACSPNSRAYLLLKSFPFLALLFEQSVIDTILAKLRTADKDLGLAFGKNPSQTKASLFPGARKGRGMWVQVKLPSSFIRSNPKGSEGITKVLPEAFPNAKGGTVPEQISPASAFHFCIGQMLGVD